MRLIGGFFSFIGAEADGAARPERDAPIISYLTARRL
jgi:hypothetical protein